MFCEVVEQMKLKGRKQQMKRQYPGVSLFCMHSEDTSIVINIILEWLLVLKSCSVVERHEERLYQLYDDDFIGRI